MSGASIQFFENSVAQFIFSIRRGRRRTEDAMPPKKSKTPTTKRQPSSSPSSKFCERTVEITKELLLENDAKSSSNASSLTRIDAETLWERSMRESRRTKTVKLATIRAIANGADPFGGRKGQRKMSKDLALGDYEVEEDAARWLTVRLGEDAFDDDEEEGDDDDATGSRGQRKVVATKSGTTTKRNLSSRFDSPDEEGEEAASTEASQREKKRRKLTLVERVSRRVESVVRTSTELRKVGKKRFDEAMCVIVDESVAENGKVDLTCARALETSAKASGSKFGVTPTGLETLKMVVDGGFGDYVFKVDKRAEGHLREVVRAEEELGPEMDVPAPKRRKLARALAQLGNYIRPKQYRIIDGVRYDEKACHLADVSMEERGKVDLACVKAIHASIQDGGSHWGITSTELNTARMILSGGTGDHKYKVEKSASKYLEDVIEEEERPRKLPTPKPGSPLKNRLLRELSNIGRKKHYRIIDGKKYDDSACCIADDSMERIGRIDLACAKEIIISVRDGGSRWGITDIEYDTIRLFLAGGRDDVLFIVDEDARAYFLEVLGTQAADNKDETTPPTKVKVRRQAPASALQSALKNPTPAMKSAAKKKGVNFTPAKKFELRTYFPSPSPSGSVNDSEEEEEEEEEAVPEPEPVQEEEEEEESESESEEEEEPVKAIKPVKAIRAGSTTPHIMTAFHRSMQFWMTPVSILDTAAACLVTLAILLIAQFMIIAYFEATITPATLKQTITISDRASAFGGRNPT